MMDKHFTIHHLFPFLPRGDFDLPLLLEAFCRSSLGDETSFMVCSLAKGLTFAFMVVIIGRSMLSCWISCGCSFGGL